jgi:class 3 adenylate cyclase/predicted ATPase
MEARGASEGERKTITALFADLKGSTALIEGLDPEEARTIIDPALQLMMNAVHRYEGYVAQALGDGIFALFGAPIAHEDHPQRALYAALRMQDEMRRYADTLRQKGYPPLLMRVGLNTGEVVLRSIHKDDLHADYMPVGHSTNLAARMEQLANPGAIVVSAYTHRLTDGYFAFRDLGPTRIKGVEEPLNIYEVLSVGPLRTRLQVAARRGLTRFVGRQREVEQLQHALRQAQAGHGQIVGVMGEPGLGKSRLFYEFKLTSQSGCLVLEAYSVSHGKASPYLPVIELLKSYFDITVEDDERKRREKITGKVLTLDRFKHALSQEVAYGTVLQDQRKALHERTAQAIESLYRTTLEDHYSQLAYHYSRSGNTPKAVEYLKLADQQAVQHSANADAITHLTTALERLKTLPDTPERARQELDLQTILGPALAVTKGFAALEVERIYTRARELCRQIGETPQLFSVLWGLWVFYEVRAELQAARELGEQLLSLAQSAQDPALLLEAHSVLGDTLLWPGELSLARAHLEQGLTLYDPHQHHSLGLLYGIDPGVVCLSFLARILWHLGYQDQALKSSDRALALATSLSHPSSLAHVLSWAAALHQLRREVRTAQERAEATLALTSEHEIAFFAAHGIVLRGWALVEQGHGQEGVAQIRQGIASYRATGAEVERPHWCALLAEACGRVGQVEEGLTVLVEALAVVDENGDRYHEAELYRLKGTLVLQSGVQGPASENPNPQPLAPSTQAEAEAQACFLKAIEISRRQQARSLELRAAMSLARLWRQQGKQEEAHALLSKIYNWFTEGFDTKDLQEAKALLDELSGE